MIEEVQKKGQKNALDPMEMKEGIKRLMRGLNTGEAGVEIEFAGYIKKNMVQQEKGWRKEIDMIGNRL